MGSRKGNTQGLGAMSWPPVGTTWRVKPIDARAHLLGIQVTHCVQQRLQTMGLGPCRPLGGLGFYSKCDEKSLEGRQGSDAM